MHTPTKRVQRRCITCWLWFEPDVGHVCPGRRDPEEDGPPTEREPRPLFREMRVWVPRDRGIAPLVRAASEIDGYKIERIEREETEAVIILKRIDRGRHGKT